MKFARILLFVSFAAIAAAGCTALPPGAYGSARGLVPVKYIDPLHDMDGCARRSDIQCSGGN